jgi:NAD/NADP transhydrogenase alpha subunit
VDVTVETGAAKARIPDDVFEAAGAAIADPAKVPQPLAAVRKI